MTSSGVPRRFIITAVGSHGDIHPYVAVGRELVSRGHRVKMLVNPYFEALTRDAGLEFEPLGEHFDLRDLRQTDIMHPRRGAKVVTDMLIFQVVPATFEAMDRLVGEFKPDAVLHHHICFAMAPICDRFKIPRASASLAPMMWLNRNETIEAGRMPFTPPAWMRPAMSALYRVMFWAMFDRPLNRELVRRGYPTIPNVWQRLTCEGDAVLGLWSPMLRGPLEGDPAGSVICGCPEHDRDRTQETPTAELEAFLAEAPEPPIVFTLGTAAVQVPGDYYDVAAQVCQRLGKRGLLLIGRGPAVPRSLPAGVRAFAYAPFSWLLPKGLLTVHHGGIGTTHAAKRAGRPMIVVPHAHDQFDNAARVRRMGISETIPRTRLGVGRLERALRTILSDPGCFERARAVAGKMLGDNGAAIAADRLELIADRPRSS